MIFRGLQMYYLFFYYSRTVDNPIFYNLYDPSNALAFFIIKPFKLFKFMQNPKRQRERFVCKS